MNKIIAVAWFQASEMMAKVNPEKVIMTSLWYEGFISHM